jgi:hypothetical protein
MFAFEESKLQWVYINVIICINAIIYINDINII